MKRTISFIPLVCLLLVMQTLNAHAQTSFRPQNLGQGVNSEYAEINPVISVDGRTLFFTRVNHPENRYGRNNSQDVWYSELLDDGTWSEAMRLPETVNIGSYNAILSAMADGRSYLIQGRFNRRGTRWDSRGFSIIKSSDVQLWGDPVPLRVKNYSRISRGRYSSAYLTPDGEILLLAFSRSPNSKNLQLYVSKREKPYKYSKPKRLRGPINHARTAEAPFLTSDKNVIYFSANYGDDANGQQIYFAHRMDNTFREWSHPIIATDTINTPNWDSYFKMNPKGSWAYFTSTTNSLGKSDIFRVKIFEEFPFVRLSGLILNQADQSLMLKETNYTIQVNGEDFQGMKIDRLSASFEVDLPLGASYTITPVMENWNGISQTINLTNVREHSKEKMDIYFSAIPFVQVKGSIINSRTNTPLPSAINPKVMINGALSDSVVFDRHSTSFQALLPLGFQYTFTVNADNFTSSTEVVDVTASTSFEKREINLYVTSHPWVEIRGQALDILSYNPIPGEAGPKLLINGQPADSITIDPTNGRFVVRLPFGTTHNLSIQAREFESVDNMVDLTTFNEFAVLNQNIFARGQDANMVTLSGKFINTKTGKQLEEGYVVSMKVNGVDSRAFTYDPATASYIIKLPVGFNYDLTPQLFNFYNKFEPVDLTKATPRSTQTRNFFVTPIEVGQSVDIENIYFETGRAVLKPESNRALNALIEFLKEYPNVRVEIGGHTDNVGSASVNERLSQERAEQVAEYVMQQGIPAQRVVAKGHGMSKPKTSNRTAEGRAKNRRVDFTITGI